MAVVLLCAVPSVSMAVESANELKPNAQFIHLENFPDMSDFDPNNPVVPTGDTIKIAVVGAFSGPAAINGQFDWLPVQWLAHAVNKQGGIFVDGKKKLIEVIKADTQSRVDVCKKVCERMALKEKVNAFVGTQGSHLMKIINDTAKRYKIISVAEMANSDELMDARNFSRYAFHTTYTTSQMGRGLAYYYGQIRKKETKFYIICQDYSFGHQLGESFKQGLKDYFPEAQVVGEDYHKLFLTDYAPYLEKIKASGAEVIYTGDWAPDGNNLLKQARQMGVMIPFAHIYLDDAVTLKEIGIEGTKGLIHISQYLKEGESFSSEAEKRYWQMWNDRWKKWEAPWDLIYFKYPWSNIGAYLEQTAWLLSVMERAKSTDPEKIIPLWEGDIFQFGNGKVVKMRACDHKTVQDLYVSETVPPEEQKVNMNMPPYCWFEDCCADGPVWLIPASKVFPWMDPALDRCKGKNGWGE